MGIRTRILRPHEVDCHAIAIVERGDWNTPWALFEKAEYRRKNGYRNAAGETGNRWQRIRCNSTTCPAEIIVAEDDLLALLPHS